MEEIIEPLSIIQHKNSLERYYRNPDTLGCSNEIVAAVISNLAFQKPTMRILDIDGGPLTATTAILEALGSRFLSYRFTDVTMKYLDNAKEACNVWGDKMKYAIFDIGKGLSGQGLNLCSYDLVIASNVLYNKASIALTMKNIRGSLRVEERYWSANPMRPYSRIS